MSESSDEKVVRRELTAAEIRHLDYQIPAQNGHAHNRMFFQSIDLYVIERQRTVLQAYIRNAGMRLVKAINQGDEYAKFLLNCLYDSDTMPRKFIKPEELIADAEKAGMYFYLYGSEVMGAKYRELVYGNFIGSNMQIPDAAKDWTFQKLCYELLSYTQAPVEEKGYRF